MQAKGAVLRLRLTMPHHQSASSHLIVAVDEPEGGVIPCRVEHLGVVLAPLLVQPTQSVLRPLQNLALQKCVKGNASCIHVD